MRYARLAGDEAGARSAHRQVIELYQQAIQALGHMPEARETLLAEIETPLRAAQRPTGPRRTGCDSREYAPGPGTRRHAG